MSELITNAYKYAFEGRREGKIRINVGEEGGQVSIEIEDDGIGLPANFEEMRKKSLGISLIETLCAQLKSEIEIEIESGDWGTRFGFTFTKSDRSGSSSTNRV